MSMSEVYKQLHHKIKFFWQACNFILGTPDKLKYPQLVDALLKLLSVVDLSVPVAGVSAPNFTALCAMQYCFSLSWRWVLVCCSGLISITNTYWQIIVPVYFVQAPTAAPSFNSIHGPSCSVQYLTFNLDFDVLFSLGTTLHIQDFCWLDEGRWISPVLISYFLKI